MREDAAAIDVRDQHDRTIDALRKTHVRDIAIAQIHFGGTARAFDDHRVKARRQAPIGREHGLERDALVFVIGPRIEVRMRVAVDDDLRAAVARRLEEHGIEVDPGIDAGRDRLQRLGATDLAAVDGHRAVERHVLRLERRDGHAAAPRSRQRPATSVLLPASDVVP